MHRSAASCEGAEGAVCTKMQHFLQTLLAFGQARVHTGRAQPILLAVREVACHQRVSDCLHLGVQIAQPLQKERRL